MKGNWLLSTRKRLISFMSRNMANTSISDKERASDEKAVEKLFKYINNGMLRRKRGAEFDLSDSDDDVEARRRRKRKEFAKMRKALLDNNGNIGKIAEDPKKIAFLRAIEDRENDEDLDFLEQPEDLSRPAIENDSQGTVGPQAEQMPEDPRTAGLGKRKRPLTDSNPDTANRLPPTARRTTSTTMKKPLSLAEIRASVSFLIEEPDAMPIAPPSSSAPASDNENDENDEKHGHAATDPLTHQPATDNDNTNNPFTSRRRPKPVIDRLSLKRNSSSSTSVTTPPSHLAFYNPSTSTPTAFKVPSLLRRATTSSFNTTGVDSHGISTLALADTERGAGGAEKGDFVRRGGTKRSSVNFAARRVVRGVEASVKEGMRRRVTREGSSLSGLGGGSFE